MEAKRAEAASSTVWESIFVGQCWSRERGRCVDREEGTVEDAFYGSS